VSFLRSNKNNTKMKNLQIFTKFFFLLIAGTLISFQSISNECPDFKTIASTIITDASCTENTEGKLELILNGTKPFNVSLSYGCENAVKGIETLKSSTSSYTFDGLIPGNYSITVTHGNGCQYQKCIEIALTNNIEVKIAHQPILCFGDKTSVKFAASGGQSPYTLYDENNEAIITFNEIYTFEGILAGEYHWSLADFNGCTQSADFAITQPDELLFKAFHYTHTSCASINDGTIQATITGGVAPYSVMLHTNCTINDNDQEEGFDKSQGLMFWGLKPGYYDITATDKNGCMLRAGCFEIEINTVNITYEIEPVCDTLSDNANVTEEGNLVNIKLKADYPGADTYKYLWSNGAETKDLKGVEQGSYSVIVTAFDIFGTALCFNETKFEAFAQCEYSDPEIPEEEEETEEQEEEKEISLNTSVESKNPILTRAYPNPFSCEVTIEFLPIETGNLELAIYNITGKRIATVFSGNVSAFEKRTFTFSGASQPEGIYFYKITSGNMVYHNKILLTR
jgi:hypothetical protein